VGSDVEPKPLGHFFFTFWGPSLAPQFDAIAIMSFVIFQRKVIFLITSVEAGEVVFFASVETPQSYCFSK